MRIRTYHLMIAVAATALATALVMAVPTLLRLAFEAIQDTTRYAPGYTEAGFQSIRPGMPESEVRRLLGEPLSIRAAREYIEWVYGPSNLEVAEDGGLSWDVPSGTPVNTGTGYTAVMADRNGVINSTSGGFLTSFGDPSACKTLGEIEARFGKPKKEIVQPSSRFLIYSGTEVSGSYYIRSVGLDASGRVNKVVAGFYQD